YANSTDTRSVAALTSPTSQHPILNVLSVSPTAMFFFFSASSAHRNLPSFPTRRSSDLQEDHQDRQQPADDRVHLDVADRGTDEGDRKSTRLNSSHVKISYAVFCLKKKNRGARALNSRDRTPFSRPDCTCVRASGVRRFT